MGIRKRGKRTWFVDVYDGKGRRIRRSVGTSKAVAVLTEKDLHLKIARGQYLGIFDTNGTPFSEYAKEWLERKKMNVSQSTWRDYKSTLEVHAIPHFGRIPLNQIRRRDVEEFLDKLGGLSGKRKNNVMVPEKTSSTTPCAGRIYGTTRVNSFAGSRRRNRKSTHSLSRR